MWQPKEERVNREWKPTGYIDNIESIEDITVTMLDRSVWKRYVREVRSGYRSK